MLVSFPGFWVRLHQMTFTLYQAFEHLGTRLHQMTFTLYQAFEHLGTRLHQTFVHVPHCVPCKHVRYQTSFDRILLTIFGHDSRKEHTFPYQYKGVQRYSIPLLYKPTRPTRPRMCSEKISLSTRELPNTLSHLHK